MLRVLGIVCGTFIIATFVLLGMGNMHRPHPPYKPMNEIHKTNGALADTMNDTFNLVDTTQLLRLTSFSSVIVHPSSGMGVSQKSEFSACEFLNVYEWNGQWFFVNNELNQNTLPACKYGYDASAFAISNVKDLPQIVHGTILETTYITSPHSKHNYHGMIEETLPLYHVMSVFQKSRYFHPRDVRLFYTNLNPVHHQGEIVDNRPTGWEKLVHNSYSAYPISSASPVLLRYARVIVPGPALQYSPLINRHGWYQPWRQFTPSPFTFRQHAHYMLPFAERIMRMNNISTAIDYSSERVCVISRVDNPSGRVILDVDKLVAHLRSVSDLTVDGPDDLSSDPVANINRIRKCRLLIMTHGQGQSNIIFMRPGAVVIELDAARLDILSFWTEAVAKSSLLLFEHVADVRDDDKDGGIQGGPPEYYYSIRPNIRPNIDYIGQLVQDLLIQERYLRPVMARQAADCLAK